MDFDLKRQLLIRYSEFVKYKKKNGTIKLPHLDFDKCWRDDSAQV